MSCDTQSNEIKKFAFLGSVLQSNSHFDVILTDVFEVYQDQMSGKTYMQG